MGKKAKKLRERRLAQQESEQPAEQQSAAPSQAAEPAAAHPAPQLPVRGLENLGNTCFFNSTMQALNATGALRPALARSACCEGSGGAGGVSRALRSFLSSMASVSEAGDEAGQVQVRKKGKRSKGSGGRGEGSSYCPGELLGAVRSAAGGSRFKGWEQQDAHELLLVVLGALEEEERKAEGDSDSEGKSDSGGNDDGGADRGAPGLGEDEQKDTQRADEVQANRHSPGGRCHLGACARAALTASDTDVVGGAAGIFRGSLCSTVECGKCGNVTRRVEPFTDISLELPLTEDEQEQLLAGKSKSKSKGKGSDKGYAFGSKGKRARAKEKAKAKSEDKEASDDSRGKGAKKLTGKKARREAKRLEKQQKDEARRRRQRQHAEAHARAVAGISGDGDDGDGDGLDDGDGDGDGDGHGHGRGDGNSSGGDGDGDGHGDTDGEAQPPTPPPMTPTEPPSPPQQETYLTCSQQAPEEQAAAATAPPVSKDERMSKWHDIAGDGLQSPPLEAGEGERAAEAAANAGGDLTIWGCLRHFTRCEQLLVSEGNGFECPRCNQNTASTDTATSDTAAEATVEGEECQGDLNDGGKGEARERAPGAEAETSAHRTLSNATKRVLPLRLPPVVVLHLKRLGIVRKISKHVTFPPHLDLTPFCMRQRNKQGDTSDATSIHHQVYRLFAVVEHSGSKHGGHYVASVRRPSDDAEGAGYWWFTSDSSTRPASEAAVLKAQAYMLFYQRIDDDNK